MILLLLHDIIHLFIYKYIFGSYSNSYVNKEWVSTLKSWSVNPSTAVMSVYTER